MYCIEKVQLTLLELVGVPRSHSASPQSFDTPILIRRPVIVPPCSPRYALGYEDRYRAPSLGPCRNFYSLFV